MGIIKLLDRLTAEKIAAGEVVERPASVIKELVENSVDAGAKEITVEIKHGGTTYMRVTDNGCGMSGEDAATAFLRHATSKISSAEDLQSIHTFGFRGEALCSIASVSRTEIFTKQKGALCGTHAVTEGGEKLVCEEAGCPDGTTVIVKNLFYNTPARMKFMKKDSVEAAAVADCLNKQALGRCDVSVRFIRDGKEILFSPGDNVLKNAVYAVYGKDIANAMLPVEYEENGIRVTGLTGKNNLSRPNRLMQVFFVNNRYIINKILSAAVAESYKNELMVGKFPVCFINIELSPELFDVNVHPGKTEIKFANEQDIYGAVYRAVKSALKQSDNVRSAAIPKAAASQYDMPFSVDRQTQIPIFAAQKAASKFKPFSPPAESVKIHTTTHDRVREELKGYEDKLPIKPIEGAGESYDKPFAEASPPTQVDSEASQKLPENAEPIDAGKEEESASPCVNESANYRIIGQLFLTYILAECGEDFILLDQHAAHERIRYEELRQNERIADTQMLLVPISVNLTPTEKALLEENSEFFLSLGFEAEDFGKDTVLLRTLPSDCPFDDGESLLIELLEIAASFEKSEFSHMRDKALYTIACKSAVKANRPLNQREQEQLFNRAMELDGISTCPHGRPISVRLTKYQIEKMFGRIV